MLFTIRTNVTTLSAFIVAIGVAYTVGAIGIVGAEPPGIATITALTIWAMNKGSACSVGTVASVRAVAGGATPCLCWSESSSCNPSVCLKSVSRMSPIDSPNLDYWGSGGIWEAVSSNGSSPCLFSNPSPITWYKKNLLNTPFFFFHSWTHVKALIPTITALIQ
jgi:hypothetical protein